MSSNLEQAIDMVARRVTFDVLDSNIGDEWGDNYPEIGEYDWDKVQTRALEQARLINPSNDEFQTADEVLTSRAEGET